MSDLDRLRKEYAERDLRLGDDDRYSLSNPAHRFMKQQLRDALQVLFNQHTNPEHWCVLEVGCGNGNVLMDFQSFGVQSLHGIDLLPARLKLAHTSYPSLVLACADGQALPYATHSFEMVAQFTAFTSILDDEIRSNMAAEMKRVLKPDGLILWYDFWWNPTNRQTRGIRPAEIRRLFPDCSFAFHKITLAPPLTRRLVPFLSGPARFLERLRIFNTHYLAVISPKMESSLQYK